MTLDLSTIMTIVPCSRCGREVAIRVFRHTTPEQVDSILRHCLECAIAVDEDSQ